MSLSTPRLAVATAVGVGHIGLGVFLSSTAPPEISGGAPVIQLTLEPIARFDGDGGADSDVATAAETAGSGGGSTQPSQPRAELRVRTPQPSPLSAAVTPAPTVEIAAAQTSTLAPSPAPPGKGPSQGPADGSRTIAGGERNSRAGQTGRGGGQTLGAAAAPLEDRYGAEVIAWIERHKRHPGGRAGGIVHVSFVLDRRGRLRASRIVNGSGVPSLDQVALSQLHAMQPFPTPPPGTTWSRRDFDVAIDYRLR
ncbi:hypothetical protein GCM10009422_21510 [Brevundimonas kwangchunensis]|uniref:TonB C-terminal domain-containing protein n=1 Tax=Brevundimonas kwangchunensis TaxID=322163 RepID=A0ABP3S3A5_9CAUL